MEEEKLNEINNGDMQYKREDDNFLRRRREHSETGVEQLQPITEENSYKSVSKQIQFLMNNNTCMKK